MAFRHIPGNSQYEYDQSPPDPGVGHPMRALWQKSENGIRTEHGQSNYVRCRRIGSGDVDHGEISKSYWDLRSSVSSYGILAFEPSFILDFKASVFNKNGVSSTFGTSITHAATTNATMTDGYGPNLVTNGGFASDSGWDKGTGWTISGGVATHSGGTDGNLNNTGYTVSVPSNKTVTLTYNISGHTAGSVRVGLAGGNAQLLTFRAANGTYTESVTNTGGNLYVRFQTSGFVGSIDNVSVRESPALKWRPHNLLTYSQDFTNANWTNNGLTVTTGQNDFEGNPTAFKLTPTAVSGLHRLYKTQVISNLVNGKLTTVAIDLKADGYNFFSVATTSSRHAVINLSDGTVPFNTGSVSPTVTSLGNGWYRCSITTSVVSQEVFSVGETAQAASFGSQTFTGDGTSGVLVAYPHIHRSDLGGMVNNPDRGDSYVPTTTTPVYLSRRGHHIYNGSAWVNEGILHESEARTNLVTYSNKFIHWTKFRVGITENVSGVTGPDGTQTVDKITPIATNEQHRVWYGVSSTAVGETYSVYAKSAGYDYVWLGYYEGSAYGYAVVNLTNGVVTASNAANYSVEASTNGFYRISVTKTASGTNPRYISISPSPTASPTLDGNGAPYYVGDGTSGVYVYGAQIEAGSTPSSYIPTGSVAATRAADTLTVPAANLPYDSTNMSIQMDGKMTYADKGQLYEVAHYFWNLNSSNRIISALQTSGSFTGKPIVEQRANGVTNNVTGANAGYSPNINVPFNIASRHGSTFVNGSHEGTLLTANTTPTVLPALSSTDLTLGYIFMGTIGEFRMWSDDLGDVGITEATLPSTEPSLQLTFDGSSTSSFTVLDWSE